MPYWLVHVSTVEVMTAGFPTAGEVCLRKAVFLFICLFAPTGLMKDGVVTSTSVQAVGGFLGNEASVSVCGFLS